MTNFSPSWKRDQVFISFRGSLRKSLVSSLKEKLERSNINFFMDECETLGSPITILFERIRESGTALIFFSDEYPESCWCLDELVVIKKQMELGSLVPFPVFYNVRAHNVKSQTGSFGNTLLRTEDLVRKKVDQGIYKSILETEALIWERRQALVSIGGRIGFSHKHTTDDDFLNKLVVKVKELVDKVSSPGNDLTIIEKPLVPPREAVTSLSHALIDDAVSLSTDHLVILDLNSLKNPVLAQQLTETGQAGSTLLVLLGSLKDNCSEVYFSILQSLFSNIVLLLIRE